MQRKLFLFVGAFLCLLFSACSNAITDEVAEGGDGSEERVTKTVSLSINEESSPMEQIAKTRGETDGNTDYAINIYKKGATGYEKFAYGLFDSAENMKLLLEEGQKYKFECLEVKDETEKVYHDGDKYYQPFRTGDEPGVITNKFVNSKTTNNSEILKGNVRVGKEEKDTTWTPMMYTLYGNLEDFDPATSPSATLDLRRAVIGYHFKIKAPKNGSVDLHYMGKRHIYIKAGDPDIDTKVIFSLHKIVEGSKDGYSAQVPISVKWTFSDGTVKDENITVTITRNKLTLLNIDFTDLTPSTVTFNEETGDLTDSESVNWTIGND